MADLLVTLLDFSTSLLLHEVCVDGEGDFDVVKVLIMQLKISNPCKKIYK